MNFYDVQLDLVCYTFRFFLFCRLTLLPGTRFLKFAIRSPDTGAYWIISVWILQIPGYSVYTGHSEVALEIWQMFR